MKQAFQSASLHMSGKSLVGSGRAAEGCRRSPGGSNSGVRCIKIQSGLCGVNEQQ